MALETSTTAHAVQRHMQPGSTDGRTIMVVSLSSFMNVVSVKLDCTNFLLWSSQTTPSLRGHHLYGYVDESFPCPPLFLEDGSSQGSIRSNSDHVARVEQDQLIISWLLSSLTEPVLAQVVGCKTSREVWDQLHVLFSSTSKTRIHDLKLELAYLKKGTLTVTDYAHKIKNLSHALAASGHFLTDVDQIHYLLGALKASLFTIVLDSPSANLANKKKTFNHNQSSSYKPRQFNNDGGSENSKKISYNNNNHRRLQILGILATVVCQLCGYPGHTAATCHRYLELTANKPTKQAHIASSSRSARDENWYPNSGATNHMTSDLGNLSLHDEYHGTYHILVGNGTGLDTSHIGSSVLNTDSGSIVLNNILRVTNISKNLLSVNQFCKDNNATFIFDATGFSVKDKATRKILIQGPIKGGLYQLKTNCISTAPSAFIGEKASVSV
ncbi:PREDICTED: uncharacterized protein LOC104593993 [Nelumbo nucifera]|uniref:Uncharacterized protein LOC104593993 n=1 Tax=Nelumbo nucifera TaxID=4432 RepID=A0A1U7ZFD2_NELNU|nr:PREDICTED: uncharacterized protein LOC104593993 [Nelumbo nucifera]